MVLVLNSASPNLGKIVHANSQGYLTTMFNLFCKEKSPWVHQEGHADEKF